MKKSIITILGGIFLIVCVLIIGTFVYYSNDEKRIEEKNKSNSEISALIKNGNYEDALVKIEECYKNVEYSDEGDGYNKMLFYQMYYDKKEMYDEEMKVILDYVSANEFTENAYETNHSYYYAVESAKKIMDKVSEENKNRAIKLLGSEITQ